MATLLIAFALSVACGVSDGDSSRDPADAATRDPRETDAPEGTVEGTVAENGAEPERGEGTFVASGEGSGGSAGAADRIEGVRFRIFEDHERLVIGFGESGGAAGVPRWSVERPEGGGYVRIRLPGVRSTRVAHESFVGSVLDEFYVVRDPGGGLFADVFALHAFRYRVTELPESGQLAVDLRGVREETGFPPTTGDGAVVLQPRKAEEVVSPLDVRGYARFIGGRITVSLLDRERDLLASKTVRASNRATAWAPFETRLGFSGYEGLATLRVGGRSPGDGYFVGTETEVLLESSGPG